MSGFAVCDDFFIISCLAKVTYCHWDASIRRLSGEALGQLSAVAPHLFVEHSLPYLLERTVSSDLFEREGSILAIAQIVLVMYRSGHSDLLTPLLECILAVPLNIVAQKLFSGRGGDAIRTAVCEYIRSLSDAGVVLPVRLSDGVLSMEIRGPPKRKPKPVKSQFQDIIDENLGSSIEGVQTSAFEVNGCQSCVNDSVSDPLLGCRPSRAFRDTIIMSQKRMPRLTRVW